MTVRLRFAMHGVRNNRIMHLVAIDQRKRRNARPLEVLGVYTPRTQQNAAKPVKRMEWAVDRIHWWLDNGALPTDSVARILDVGGIKRHTPEEIIEHKKKLAIAEQQRLAAAQKQHEADVVAQVMRKRVEALLRGDAKALHELESVQEGLESEDLQEDDDSGTLSLEDFRRGVQRYGPNPLEALEEEDETLGTDLERQRHAAAQDPFALKKRIYDVEVNRSLELAGATFGSSASSSSQRDTEQWNDVNNRANAAAVDLGPFSKAAALSHGDDFDESPSANITFAAEDGSQLGSAAPTSDASSSTAKSKTVQPLDQTRPVDPKSNGTSGTPPPTL